MFYKRKNFAEVPRTKINWAKELKLLKNFEKNFEAMKSAEWDKKTEAETILSRINKATRAYTIACKGDVCAGDEILFVRRVWERIVVNGYGKLANAIVDYDLIPCVIVCDSYGTDKGQHTFTYKILGEKEKHFVKGRNLYAIGVWRKKWENESKRREVLAEKHERGRESYKYQMIKKDLI